MRKRCPFDKDVWNRLSEQQQDAIRRAAKDSLVQSFTATESAQCRYLRDMLDINKDGVEQRNVDGSPRLVDGRPVSAAMTLAKWPDDALDVLLDSRNQFMASLEGPQDPNAKTDEQRDFTVMWGTVQQFVKSIDASDFDPGAFPGTIGLSPGWECNLVR